jgi:hypothetical protein
MAWCLLLYVVGSSVVAISLAGQIERASECRLWCDEPCSISVVSVFVEVKL